MSLLRKLGFGKKEPQTGNAGADGLSSLADELAAEASASRSAKAAASASSNGAEKRAYKRFPLSLPAIMHVDFGDGNLIPIRDVSYGGFVADVGDVPNQSRLPEGMQVKVLTLKDSMPMTVGYVYSRGHATAFRFHHNSPESLLFLREPLESLRQGSTLVPISGANLKAPYNQAGWNCHRGDGPTDLIMAEDAKNQVTEALMTFRFGEMYYEISLRGGVIRVSRSIDSAGYAGSRMAQTDQEEEDKIIKKGLYILSGISDKGTRKLSDQLFQMMAELYLKKP